MADGPVIIQLSEEDAGRFQWKVSSDKADKGRW